MATTPRSEVAATTAAAAASIAAAVWLANHRRSVAVRRWRPPTLPGRHHSRLYARSGGKGERTYVLLHGLAATGDVFGGHYDALADGGRLVVPDLLGFGRSLDPSRERFDPADHLDALDELLLELGAERGPVVIGGHSMGAALGLRWAERNVGRVERVVCWGAPVYADEAEVRAAIARTGTMARLFATDTALAEWACGWNCRHRIAAGWLAAATTPSLPVAISRAASLHTWDAYRDAMTGLVMATDWAVLTGRLAAEQVEVRFISGEHDPIGDRGLLADLARTPGPTVVRTMVGADHHLPISHPEECIAQLRRTL